MRNERVRWLIGPLAWASLVLALVAIGLLAAMVVWGAPWWAFAGVAIVLAALLYSGARTVVRLGRHALRVVGEEPVMLRDIDDVGLYRIGRMRFPEVTLSHGRAVDARLLDGLARWWPSRGVEAQARRIAEAAGCPFNPDPRAENKGRGRRAA